MLVNVFNENGELESGAVEVNTCFDESDDELTTCIDALKSEGEYVVGGGAAPLFTIKPVHTEAALCTEYQTWCAANKLPAMSADELACEEGLTGEQRVWLGGFIKRWEEAGL